MFKVKVKQTVLIIFYLVCVVTANGQNTDWREVYERIFAADIAEESTEIDEDVMEHLDDIAAHPFNINTITQEQLEELPFLSTNESNAISLYIYRYGGMMTLQELQAIPELSYDKRQLLRYFLYCGEKEKKNSFTLKNILKHGTHDLYYGGKIPTYERRGDALQPKDGGYLGPAYKHQFRYTFSYNQDLKIGIVGANDSGEQFFAGRNGAGFDFYSFYAQLKNRPLGKRFTLGNLVVGRYRAGFGMGLVVNNNFSLGKSTMMSAAIRVPNGFRPHSSTSDGNYFQGLAATFNINHGNATKHCQTKISLFSSIRKIHATVTSDTISTIINSGYHRTENEMRKKNAASETVIGANLQFEYRKLSVGATATGTFLSKTLMPDKRQAFRRFYPEGRKFFNAGINYAFNGYKLTFMGETAISDSLAVATINTLTYRPIYDFSLTLLHRYFSHNYTVMNARTFSENSLTQDENGIFAGLNWSITRTFSLNYYADYAKFRYPKYQVSFPSQMIENTLLASWHKGEWAVSLRGRLKKREYDNSEKTALVWKNTASVRLQGEFIAGKDSLNRTDRLMGLRTRLTLQYSHYDKEGKHSNGFLALVNGGFKPWKWLSLDITAAYFNTDDYYSAIYAYERGMSYNMAYLQLYGKGMRLALSLQSQITSKLSATLKVGSTKYFDRELIGTALEEIQSSRKTDIDFQIKWRI